MNDFIDLQLKWYLFINPWKMSLNGLSVCLFALLCIKIVFFSVDSVIKQAHRGCGRPFLQWRSSTLMLCFTCPYILNIYFMAAQTVLKPVYHCPWMENQARIWGENYRTWLDVEWLMRSEQLFPSGRITLTLFSGKLLTLSTIGSKQEHNPTRAVHKQILLLLWPWLW